MPFAQGGIALQEQVQLTSANLMAPAAAASCPPNQADACQMLLESDALARPTDSRAAAIVLSA